jgi:WD40-like Beta Propeller Repeat
VRFGVGLLVVAASCGGRTINLGQSGPAPYHFGAPVLVEELAGTGHRDNPTLTADLLEIYFTTNEDPQSNGDVWSAQRTSASAAFGTAAPVIEINSTDRETSSAISADGLTLWFGSDRPGGSGGLDVWVAQRASRSAGWSAPTNLAALNTSADDIPRPPGQHQLVMPMASTKTTPSNTAARVYQTFLTSRSNAGGSFQAPSTIPEIDQYNRSVVDGSLSDDGLALFFSSTSGSAASGSIDAGVDGGATDSDIFAAFRLSTNGPFVVVEPIAEINTGANDRDPWLSPNGSVFYFTSDRAGARTSTARRSCRVRRVRRVRSPAEPSGPDSLGPQGM